MALRAAHDTQISRVLAASWPSNTNVISGGWPDPGHLQNSHLQLILSCWSTAFFWHISKCSFLWLSFSFGVQILLLDTLFGWAFSSMTSNYINAKARSSVSPLFSLHIPHLYLLVLSTMQLALSWKLDSLIFLYYVLDFPISMPLLIEGHYRWCILCILSPASTFPYFVFS